MRNHPPAALVLLLPLISLVWLAVALQGYGPSLGSVHRVIETHAATFVAYAGRFHPLAVHFPVAFIFGAAVLDVVALLRREPTCRVGSRLLLWLGVAGIAVAIPLGFAATAEYGRDGLVRRHEAFALASLAVALCALVAREAAYRSLVGGPRSALARGLLLLTSALVAWTGFLGAELVHGVGHLSWPF